jgi:hypothetical protein
VESSATASIEADFEGGIHSGVISARTDYEIALVFQGFILLKNWSKERRRLPTPDYFRGFLIGTAA